MMYTYVKLKPFAIAIRGAIDGYSRKILWLKASNTNNNPPVVARYYIIYKEEFPKNSGICCRLYVV